MGPHFLYVVKDRKASPRRELKKSLVFVEEIWSNCRRWWKLEEKMSFSHPFSISLFHFITEFVFLKHLSIPTVRDRLLYSTFFPTFIWQLSSVYWGRNLRTAKRPSYSKKYFYKYYCYLKISEKGIFYYNHHLGSNFECCLK